MSFGSVYPAFIQGVTREKLLSQMRVPGSVEIEIPPRSSSFHSLNAFYEHVSSCQAACVKVTGGSQTIIAIMKGVKDMELRMDNYDPSSVIGCREDSWDFYALLPQGRKKVDEDPIDVESFDEKLKLETENCSVFSIKRLKKDLDELGVDYTGFCEKSEFVSALAEARVSGRGNENKFAEEPKELFAWAVHEGGNHVSLNVLKNPLYSAEKVPEITSNSSRMASEAVDYMKKLESEGKTLLSQEDNLRKGGLSKDPHTGLVWKPQALKSRPFFYDDERMLRSLIEYGSDGKLEWQEVPAAGGGNELNVLFAENKIVPNLNLSIVQTRTEHVWKEFYYFIHSKLSVGECVGNVFALESCDFTIPLHNGRVHTGDWYIYATGDADIVTFFAVENEHGYYVAQMGPMPVKSMLETGKKPYWKESRKVDSEGKENEEKGAEKDTTD